MSVCPLGHPARHLGVVGSTMTEAAAWAREGAPHGALVVAEHQRAGRGRWGRAWDDAPGQSLMLSLVLRPALTPERAGLVGLAAGLALAEALGAFGVGAGLKWPNDVRVGGRKLAGVLAEASWAGRGHEAGALGAVVVLGVGLNVEQAAFPPALADRATSLRLVTGRPVERLAPLDPFLRALERRLADAERDPARLVAAVQDRLEQRGEEVTVAFPGTDRAPVEGRVVGLAPTGALRLATASGEIAVHAGEVTLAVPS